jgi:hypothetical protein
MQPGICQGRLKTPFIPQVAAIYRYFRALFLIQKPKMFFGGAVCTITLFSCGAAIKNQVFLFCVQLVRVCTNRKHELVVRKCSRPWLLVEI